MATNSTKTVNNASENVKQTKAGRDSFPVRIKSQTKSNLDDLLKRANKNHVGRKIKADDVICYALKLLSNENLAEISQAALTNRDKFELLFKLEQKKNRALNRDSFYGLLLRGCIRIDD